VTERRVECERYYKMSARYMVGFMQICDWCDSPYKQARVFDLPDSSWDDVETDPGGWATVTVTYPKTATYRCLACHTQTVEFPDDVANGQGCRLCSGDLLVVP
jgi:hypothetical protein